MSDAVKLRCPDCFSRDVTRDDKYEEEGIDVCVCLDCGQVMDTVWFVDDCPEDCLDVTDEKAGSNL